MPLESGGLIGGTLVKPTASGGVTTVRRTGTNWGTPAQPATNPLAALGNFIGAGGAAGVPLAGGMMNQQTIAQLGKLLGTTSLAKTVASLASKIGGTALGTTLGTAAVGLLGAGAAGYGIGQLIGGGEGDVMVNGVLLQGPGEKEPYPGMIAKEWTVNNAHFFLLIDGRIVVRSYKTGRVKVYRPQKHIVLSRNPKVKDLLRGAKRVDNLLLRFDRRVKKFRSRVKGTYFRRRRN